MQVQLGRGLGRKPGGCPIFLKQIEGRGSSEDNVKQAPPGFNRLSNRNQCSAGGVLFAGLRLTPTRSLIIGIGISLAMGAAGFLLLIGPLKDRIISLETEKSYWQGLRSSPRETSQRFVIPTLDKLPDTIEECQTFFQAQGVTVKAFNVERFASATGNEISNLRGRANGNEADAKLDFALVRMHWEGSWQNIEKGIAKMEEAPGLGITVQEVHLNQDGGQGVFRIYFRSQ